MADTTATITFTPNPTQHNFIQSRARAAAFSGRMREGKSAALAWSPFYHTRYNPGAKWAMIRDTWVNLERTTLAEFFRWFPPGIMGRWVAGNKTYHWQCVIDGAELRGEVLFLGLDDPNDAGKLQSLTLAGFGMDEVAPAIESGGIPEALFRVAMTRLSQPSMQWLAARLAFNNPDEDHWVYSTFVDPGTDGYEIYQPALPENVHNLPAGYYQELKRDLASRPDLWRRFGEGKFGFTMKGKQVTPEWVDEIHLASARKPIRGIPLILLWDFGLNPTCLITQVTPLGNWNVLWADSGDGIGVEELIENRVKPTLQSDYTHFDLRHIGDPAGNQREQSNSKRSAVNSIRKMLGGGWQSGPTSEHERVQAIRGVLRRHNLLAVDRTRAKCVWHALRGGWHRNISNTGVVGSIVKDRHSHPGDALAYGAAVLYPLGKITGLRKKLQVASPSILQAHPRQIPKEARRLP